MNTRSRPSYWLLILSAIAMRLGLAASDPSPPPFGYELQNPRPGQLDANHWKRQPWTGTVSNVTALPGGRLLISGPVRLTGRHGFTNLAVLDRFGWADTNAPRYIAAPPFAIATQADGRLAIALAGGGEVRFFGPNFEPDSSWSWPRADWRQLQHTVTCLKADGNGNWLVGGIVGNIWSGPMIPFVDRVRPDGDIESCLDIGYVIPRGDAVSVDLIQPTANGRLVVAIRIRPPNFTGTRSQFVRLIPGGFPDNGFVPAPSWEAVQIRAMVTAPDGRAYVAYHGSISTQTGQIYRGVCRLNADGTIDTTFSSQFSRQTANFGPPEVNGLLMDPQGRLIVGGFFRLSDRGLRSGLIRLFEDGSVDASFQPGESFSGAITALQWDQGQRILVAGEFTATDRIAGNDVVPPLSGGSTRTLSYQDLAILHNTDRPLAAPPQLANGVYSVESFLPASGYLILERSTDMVHWQGFRTNFAAGTNWLRASFPINEPEVGEFYRVSVRP